MSCVLISPGGGGMHNATRPRAANRGFGPSCGSPQPALDLKNMLSYHGSPLALRVEHPPVATQEKKKDQLIDNLREAQRVMQSAALELGEKLVTARTAHCRRYSACLSPPEVRSRPHGFRTQLSGRTVTAALQLDYKLKLYGFYACAHVAAAAAATADRAPQRKAAARARGHSRALRRFREGAAQSRGVHRDEQLAKLAGDVRARGRCRRGRPRGARSSQVGRHMRGRSRRAEACAPYQTLT